jgi:hypothetical protein
MAYPGKVASAESLGRTLQRARPLSGTITAGDPTRRSRRCCLPDRLVWPDRRATVALPAS